MTKVTKLRKITEQAIRGLLLFPSVDLVAILLFLQTDLQADLTGLGTKIPVMLGAGSSDPTNHRVLAADQAHALGCMLLPVLSSLFTECEELFSSGQVPLG